MRCFIALDLPIDIKKQINHIINIASPLSKDIKWVPYDNIHLTLKFLGEVNETLIKEIEKRLRDICSGNEPFSINVRGIGAFPNEKVPNVLWVGIEQSENLRALFKTIDHAISELGFEREKRKHSPHLTIGRVKDKKDVLRAIKALNEFRDKSFGTAYISEVHLMRSVLKLTGAEYSKISSFKLQRKQF